MRCEKSHFVAAFRDGDRHRRRGPPSPLSPFFVLHPVGWDSGAQWGGNCSESTTVSLWTTLRTSSIGKRGDRGDRGETVACPHGPADPRYIPRCCFLEVSVFCSIFAPCRVLPPLSQISPHRAFRPAFLPPGGLATPPCLGFKPPSVFLATPPVPGRGPCHPGELFHLLGYVVRTERREGGVSRSTGRYLSTLRGVPQRR